MSGPPLFVGLRPSCVECRLPGWVWDSGSGWRDAGEVGEVGCLEVGLELIVVLWSAGGDAGGLGEVPVEVSHVVTDEFSPPSFLIVGVEGLGVLGGGFADAVLPRNSMCLPSLD